MAVKIFVKAFDHLLNKKVVVHGVFIVLFAQLSGKLPTEVVIRMVDKRFFSENVCSVIISACP